MADTDADKPFQRSWEWYDKIWKTVGKCVFCDLNEKYVVYEKNGIVLTANKFPYTNAHLLIVPRRHIEYVKELTQAEWETLRGVMYIAKKILRKVYNRKNLWFIYREGAMGQAQKTVGHLHVQVIPYTDGLVTINYQKISDSPAVVGKQLRGEQEWMDSKFDKFLQKYGSCSSPEKRIVVGAVIQNKEGDVLLVKKEHGGYPNTWQFPAGSLEGEESLIEALKKEVREETNLKIGDISFVDIREDTQRILFPEGFTKNWRLILIHYSAKRISGRLKAGDDAMEVRWVPRKEITNIALSPITQTILKKHKIL